MQETTAQEVSQEPKAELSPYDTSSEQQEYDTLLNELEQSQATLENDLAIDIARKITPELEELFFEDKEEFLREVFKMQNEFLETKIKPKAERAKELGTSIEKKQTMQSIENAQNEFLQNHPEVNPNELMDFFMQLPPQVQEQLSQLPPEQFFETLLEAYNQSQQPSQEAPAQQEQATQGNALPTQIKGVGNNTALSESGNNLPMERF